MKKICCLALSLVLTAALFAGCGCTNRNSGRATTPTELPTSMPTMPSTEAATVPTTQATNPTAQATHPTNEETTDTGNGVLEDETTDHIESTREAEGRARGVVPNSGR